MNIYELINNLTENQTIKSKSTHFLVVCIEAKVLVDRWGNITTDFFVSPNTFSKLKFSKLFGADIQSSSLVKDNELIAINDVNAAHSNTPDTMISKCIVSEWNESSFELVDERYAGLNNA
jgi:hypothetical protein